MKALERAMMEKAGCDYGWEFNAENKFSGAERGSARYPPTARVAPSEGGWLINLSSDRLSCELARARNVQQVGPRTVAVCDMDVLASTLGRAAELAQSLPTQSLSNYERVVCKILETRANRCRHEPPKGLVIRPGSANWCEARAKLVCTGFAQIISDYWRSRAIGWNRLQPPGGKGP